MNHRVWLVSRSSWIEVIADTPAMPPAKDEWLGGGIVVAPIADGAPLGAAGVDDAL